MRCAVIMDEMDKTEETKIHQKKLNQIRMSLENCPEKMDFCSCIILVGTDMMMHLIAS